MPATETESARQEVNALLGTKRWNRIVVDVTQLRSVPTALELVEFSRRLSLDLPRSARIALVVQPDQAKHTKLIEIVARSGGAFMRFFIDAEKAQAWMRGDPAAANPAKGE